MQVLKKTVKVSGLEFYKKHLEILNCVLPIVMTSKEIMVLASIMYVQNTFDSILVDWKKEVCKILSIEKNVLNYSIRNLVKKGFLIRVGDKIEIFSKLVIGGGEQVYYFKIEE